MTESFNAHDILAKLRAKSLGEGSSKHVSLSPTPNTNIKQNNQSNKIIKGPSSLTLTPSQRQENLTIRNELEKDIKTLQDEVAALKLENKQLRADKEDVERQFIEYKVTNEKRITHLRGKIASQAMGVSSLHGSSAEVNKVASVGVGGKIYPPAPGPTSPKRASSSIHNTPSLSPTHGKIHTSTMAHIHGLQYHPGHPLYQEEESFRDITFSQLMRRRTHDHPDFQESLRRSDNKRVPVPHSSHNSATKLPPRSANQQYDSIFGGYFPAQPTAMTSSGGNSGSGHHNQLNGSHPHSYHSLYTHGGGNDLYYPTASAAIGSSSSESKVNNSHLTAVGNESNKRLSLHDLQQQQHHHQDVGSTGPSSSRKLSTASLSAVQQQQNNLSTPSSNFPNNNSNNIGDYSSVGGGGGGGNDNRGGDSDQRSEVGSDDLEVVEIDLRY